ncbi:MAG: 2,3-epoxybenzoyl-CoA dihydrolase [Rhodospirillales bacterium]
MNVIDFRTEPSAYRHWSLKVEGNRATLTLDVQEDGGLFEGYELKLNSYDLGVDIELADAVQRLRFEHPEVAVVVVRSGKDRVFCAGANIRMLGGATHGHKVNFCKFTNETRNTIEEASSESGQAYICAVNGTAAGGGYELALAADHIMLVDDGSASVSLPEVPLLAVLPGTGGLTRLVDKRKVRRDLADVFSTTEEGVRGERAVAWRLVDEIAPSSTFEEAIDARVAALAAARSRPEAGIALPKIERRLEEDSLVYDWVEAKIDRRLRSAEILLRGPDAPPPTDAAALLEAGAAFWPLALTRQLDDLLLHLRFNEPEIGCLVIKSEGEAAQVLTYDAFLQAQAENWLAGEALLAWRRVMKRLELTARSLFVLVEPGSCFAGFLAEPLFAADRSYMLAGQFEGDNRPPATLSLSQLNFGRFPMANGLSRLATRFLGEPDSLSGAEASIGEALEADAALSAGLVTFAPDDIDWEDEIRLLLEERASFSPDALTGMEANLRFAGPETMESKIFARLTAWQNWIFQRPNAVGEAGALRLYGTGTRPAYDKQRV